MEDTQDNKILENWLVSLVSGMVSHPEAVVVESGQDEMGTMFIVRVADGDAGRIIGKEGQHAQAIRALLRCAGSNYNIRATVTFDVPLAKHNNSN